jgi:hypothetical protein
MMTSCVFLIKDKHILKESVMSVDIKQNVNTNSTEFSEGVEAGLNSAEDTKNWKAGNELGQALKEEDVAKGPIRENPVDESSTPLFLRGSPGNNKGNAQDEKDKTGE